MNLKSGFCRGGSLRDSAASRPGGICGFISGWKCAEMADGLVGTRGSVSDLEAPEEETPRCLRRKARGGKATPASGPGMTNGNARGLHRGIHGIVSVGMPDGQADESPVIHRRIGRPSPPKGGKAAAYTLADAVHHARTASDVSVAVRRFYWVMFLVLLLLIPSATFNCSYLILLYV